MYAYRKCEAVKLSTVSEKKKRKEKLSVFAKADHYTFFPETRYSLAHKL